MSDLKPCPYCGGEAKLFEGEECAYVQCLSVKIHRGPFVDGDNDATHAAIAAWNDRVTPDPLSDPCVKALVEALAEIVDHCQNSGRGCLVVDDRIVDRCEDTARAALRAIGGEA